MEEMQSGQKNTLMGVLAYLGPLVIIPFILSKEDPFVKFHIKQGLVLFVIEIALWVLVSFFWMLFYQFWMIYQLVNLGIFILVILGVINVVQGKEAELPLVGQFSRYFTF
jgi:uncharacterized membrane protein